MNAKGYYEELTGEDVCVSAIGWTHLVNVSASATGTKKQDTINQIMAAELPAVHNANLRKETRKEWAKQVRSLLKELGIKGVSVRARNYSMAHSIDVEIPYDPEWNEIHTQVHEEAEKVARSESVYRGVVHYCSFCKARNEAENKLRELILAAFPDLDDRSDSQSDYFDFCLVTHS